MRLYFEASPGNRIEDAAKRAVILAKAADERVGLLFNATFIEVWTSDQWPEVVSRYWKARGVGE